MANTTIPSELIAADAITGAKIADNAVDSEHYTDGSIDTAHIADDQVTLAKMAGLARGKIIVGDSSGNPAALAIGTNGYVLKSDGTDIAWAADATVAALTSEQVQDIAGAMFSSNTETGITATYQDADGTIDLVVGTLNQNTTGSAATLTTARTIGGVSFDGSANINLPGVNTAGNQNVDAALVDGENFKINGGQGSDGQVLTSTGSGVAWEDAASGGLATSGGTLTGDVTFADGADIITASAGTSNFRAGVNAGNSIASGGNYNVVVGDEAGTALTTGDFNTSVGYGALSTEDTASRSTAVGYRALLTQNAGDVNAGNTAIGYDAGFAITTGVENTLMGFAAGDALTDADFNVAVGRWALTGDTKGSKSVAVGYNSLGTQNFTSSTDSFNTAVGFQAGLAVTTGVNNSLIGGLAGDAITTGSQNTGIGVLSLSGNTTGASGTAVGYAALLGNTTGCCNTGLGKGAMQANTTGAENVAVGDNALNANTTATGNTAVGCAAADANTTGSALTAIGYGALGAHTTGDSNSGLGYQVGRDVTTGADNVFVGRSAGQTHTTGTTSVAVGVFAGGGTGAKTGANNVSVGYIAGAKLTSGSQCVAVGNNAGGAVTSANGNTLIGDSAGYGVTTGYSNTFVGNAAGAYTVLTTTGTDNTMVGALSHATSATAVNVNVFGRNVAGEQGYTTIGLDSVDIRAAHGNVTWATVSDRRVKKDIEDSTAGLSFINDLRPRTFNFKNKGDLPKEFTGSYEEGSTEAYKSSKTQHGFIAQEVKEAIDNHSDITDGFKLWDVRETGQQEVAEAALIPMLVKAIQELSAEVEKLKGE